MPENPNSEVASLKRLAVFDDLPDETVAKVALLAKNITLAKDDELLIPETTDAPFYMVLEGKIQFEPDKMQRGQRSYVMNPGEFFGANAVLFGKSRAMRVVALEPARLIKLDARTISALLQQEPHLQQNLSDASIMYRRLHGRHFLWIDPEEMVQEIIHEHPVYLLVGFLRALGIALAGVIFMVTGPLTGSVALTWFFEIAGTAILVVSFLWALWEYIDWDNDYYVVTDRRIAWVEQILGLYDSRDEILLSEVRSVEPETTFIGRILKYANLYVIDNFQRKVVFRHIRNHLEVKRVIETLAVDAKKRQEQLDLSEVDKTMRAWIAPPAAPAPLKPGTPPAPLPRIPVPVRVREYFDFRMRLFDGNTIIYRRHLIFLLLRQSPAYLAALILPAGMFLLINARLNNDIDFPTVPTTLLLGLLGLVAAAFWWWYCFEDWRNDTYQVTPDKIVMRQKKPLSVDRRSDLALLSEEREEVIGLQYRRGSIFKVFLNYGEVILTVKIPAETHTRIIKDVYDPARVHQDIFDRIYVKKRKKAQDDLVKTGQLKDWFAAYHRQTNGAQRPQNRGLDSFDSG